MRIDIEIINQSCVISLAHLLEKVNTLNADVHHFTKQCRVSFYHRSGYSANVTYDLDPLGPGIILPGKLCLVPASIIETKFERRRFQA